MNDQLLLWGLFSFMIGIVLSLPLAAVIYNKNSTISKFFTNVRKLKSAHLDYFTQAFAMGFAYLLEYSLKMEVSSYVVIPLIYGTMMNPTILLLEATPFIRSGWLRIIYKLLKATSPISLLFSWFVIAFLFLPFFLKILFIAVTVMGGTLLLTHQHKTKKHLIEEKTAKNILNP
jgi:hypothetical protein